MSQLISKQETFPESHLGILYCISYNVETAKIDFKIKEEYQPYLPSIKQSMKYFMLNEAISHFSSLPPNWDSYNADVISKTAIKISQQVLQYLNNEDYIFDEFEINVFPMRDGGIQYEFDKKQVTAELEINPSGEMNFIHYDQQGNILKAMNLPINELSELSSLLEESDYA